MAEVITFPGANLDRDIRRAIADKRLVEVTYSGVRRVAEPHDYGILNGTPKLLAYQLRGGRSPAPAWRLFEFGKIEALRVLDQTFSGSRGAAHREHQQW